MISAAAHRVLIEMRDAEDRDDLDEAELVQEGREAWIGLRRTTVAVVYQLLRWALIKDNGCSGGGMYRYSLNEDGRLAAGDRSYVPPELIGEKRTSPPSAGPAT